MAGLGLAGSLLLAGCSSPVEAQTETTAPIETVETEEPEEAQSIETQPTESAFEALPRGEELAEQFRIPTGLSTEELATTVLQRLDDWENWGGTQEVAEEILDMEGDFQPVVEAFAQETADTIESAMVTDEAIAQDSFDFRRDRHFETLRMRVLTGEKEVDDPDNYEPYRRWSELVSVHERDLNSPIHTRAGYNPKTDRSIAVTYLAKDNGELNRSGELFAGGQWISAEGVLVESTFTLKDGGDGYLYFDEILTNILSDNE